jgi:hypothetical protein
MVRSLRRPTKYRPSGPKMPPPGFRPSMRPLSRTMRPCEEIANTRSAPLFRNSKFSFGSTARPRGSTMRSSSINIPRRVPSNSKLSSAPKPSPFVPDALVTSSGIAAVLRNPKPLRGQNPARLNPRATVSQCELAECSSRLHSNASVDSIRAADPVVVP